MGMLRVGDVVSEKYDLIRPLGAGGMGAVWEARHTGIGKRVSIKFLHQHLSDNPEAAARFTREAQAAAAIGHRSIIDIYDCGKAEDGSIYLVMEFLEGRDMGALLGQKGQLPVELTVYLAAQTLSALTAAHRASIVHRDLKPDNIFLVETGQRLPDVKLLDFGISKMTSQDALADRLTKTGVVMGTPFYMSPEQAQGAKEADHRADLYAMGVIMYEACTGRTPFQADNLFALIQEILFTELIPPRQLRPDLPDALEQVILRAMSRNLDIRYDSAAEMLDDVLPFLGEAARERVPLPTGMPQPRDTEPLFSALTLPAEVTPPRDTTADDDLDPTPPVSTNMAWPSQPPTPPSTGRSPKRLIWGLALSALMVFGGGAVVLALMTGSGRQTQPADPPPPPLPAASIEAPLPPPPAAPPPPEVVLQTKTVPVTPSLGISAEASGDAGVPEEPTPEAAPDEEQATPDRPEAGSTKRRERPRNQSELEPSSQPPAQTPRPETNRPNQYRYPPPPQPPTPRFGTKVPAPAPPSYQGTKVR
jgi:serine/threonine-protein kinase